MGSLVPQIWYRCSSKSTGWGHVGGTLATGTGNNGTWNFTIDYTQIASYSPQIGDVIQYYVVAQDGGSPINLSVPSIGRSKPYKCECTSKRTYDTEHL